MGGGQTGEEYLQYGQHHFTAINDNWSRSSINRSLQIRGSNKELNNEDI
jgi:hypothetical protein